MRTLHIAHNHPDISPGGTEIVALQLHRAALARGEDSWFLAAVDATDRPGNPGTNLIGMDKAGREHLLWTPGFDRFNLSQPDAHGALRAFGKFLRTVKPDLIHFHHVLNIGLEAIATARAKRPEAKIHVTLHDYLLMCPAHGQLYRHDEETRCDGPGPDSCPRCVGAPPLGLALREVGIAHAMAMADRIIAPSRFLARAFIANTAWGKRLEVRPNPPPEGPRLPPPPPRPPEGPMVLGYFGNLAHLKGIGDLAAAMHLLKKRGVRGIRLHVHGSQLFEDPRVPAAMRRLKRALGARLLAGGRYARADLPRLMEPVDAVVFPSLWWENAPLTVIEALHHHRPVIAYPHGGAPELLAADPSSRLAPASHPAALADTIEAMWREGSGAAAL